MTRVLLVRHARPASEWDAGGDAGLDPVGRSQADGAAALLAGRGVLAVVTSPLRRARETAAPIATVLRVDATLEPAVGEIPSTGVPPQERAAWLREQLGARWPDLDAGLRTWRAALLDALLETARDTIVVTHFVAINAATGAATDDDRVTCWSPAHASITELALVDGRLRLVQRGTEAATTVR